MEVKIALIFKSAITFKLINSSSKGDYTQFEHMDCEIGINTSAFHLAIVYRPPPSSTNNLSTNKFFDEWPAFLSSYATISKEVLIVGDLNFHLDQEANRDTQYFVNCLNAGGFQQHVKEPTHVLGHTLDDVISRDNSSLVSEVVVTDPGLGDHQGRMTHDHFAVTFTTSMSKPSSVCKTISFRKFHTIDVDKFRQDIRESSLSTIQDRPVDELVQQYSDGLETLVDKHAPLC